MSAVPKEERGMRLGILADIHEEVELLRRAIDLLSRHGADRFVVLGDVFETGRRIEETVPLLREVQAVGVWGNHDLGLCDRPTPAVRAKYAGLILEYMQTLRPRLELESCLFTHGLPCWDAADPAVYYLGERPETPEGLAHSFAASSQLVSFVGHFHRWLLGTAEGILPWRGERPLSLSLTDRYLVVIHAVSQGHCALFDTEAGLLTPLGEG
jgi:predicted phosphodiesterase